MLVFLSLRIVMELVSPRPSNGHQIIHGTPNCSSHASHVIPLLRWTSGELITMVLNMISAYWCAKLAQSCFLMDVWPPEGQWGQKGWEGANATSVAGGRQKASHVIPAAPLCARSGFNQGCQPSISCTIKLTAEMKRPKENGWKRQPTVCNRKSKQAPSFQRVAASLLLFILEMKSSCNRVLS